MYRKVIGYLPKREKVMSNKQAKGEDNTPYPIANILSQIKSESVIKVNQRSESEPQEYIPLIEKIRLMIVCIATLLALLSFIAFIITGNSNALVGTSVLTYPLFRVVDYYFGRTDTLNR